MTAEEKIEALKALISGEWDNSQLIKIGDLFPDAMENVKTILYYGGDRI